MYARKRFGRLIRSTTLCALFVCVVFAQLASGPVSFASADTPATESGVIETVRAVESSEGVPIAFLSVPGLSWESLNKADSPEAKRFLDDSALGNLSSPKDWVVANLLEAPNIGIYRSAESSLTAPFAQAINDFIDKVLPPNCILIIVTDPAFAGAGVLYEFTPVIIHGGELSGYLTSDSTHRSGLITTQDFSALIHFLNEPADSPSHSKASIESFSTSDSTQTRIDSLWHDATTTAGITQTKVSANFAFLVLVFVSFAVSILLFFLGRRERPGSRDILVPTVRILWLLVLACPPATFLMFTVLPAQPTPADLTLAVVIWVAVISFAALLFGYFTKWVNSLIALYGLTIAVILVGQVFGGPLDTPGYLTYNIIEGSRYYGMGNEQGAMFFGSWITLSGLLINRFPNARGIPAFKKWGYPLGSAILLFIATSPWFGASFGPLVWGFLGCFVSWWLFNGRRLRWWGATLIVTAAFTLALGVLYADVALNPLSHMNQVAPTMHEGFFSLVTQLAVDVWAYSFNLIYDYVPAVLVLFLAFVFVLLVVLRVLQPGSYREFWQRNTAFRAVYSVCFVLAAITFVLEDSGVFTPAVLLIYPLACFTWLICDLHTWHLKALEASSRPITLRELQQSAIRLVAHGETKKEATEQSKEPEEKDESLAPDAPPEREPEVPPGEEPETPSVGRSTVTMSMATLISRITGFIRTWAMAFALGNTAFTSAYIIANNLPNMLYELIAGGVLTTAFLPIYLAQLEKRGKDGAAGYASNLLSISAIVLGVIALVATIFAPQVIFTQSFLTKDLDIASAVFFFRFFAVQIIFYGVGAIISGLLNANRSFLWPALGPVFNNIAVIITLFGYPFIARINPLGAMVWLAVGTTLGVVAMFVAQIPALIKLNIHLRFHIDLRDPALKDTLKMALPAALFIVMNLIAVSVMNAFSLDVTLKGPATIQFAWLWYQLPYGVIAVALSTALLTEMSEASAAEDWDTFRANMQLGLRTTLFLIIPLAAIIFTLSNQLAGLYHAGAFTHEDVLKVANVVATWCLALPFYATYMFIYRVFSAMRDLKRFIAIDACGRILLVFLYGFFTTGFGVWDGFGLIGIPLADACVYVLLCAVMLFVLRKRIGSFGLSDIVKDGLKILGASFIAIMLPLLVTYSDYDQSIQISLVTIVFCGLFALAVYYFFCRLFRVPEISLVNALFSKLTARLRRKHE